MVLDLIKEVYSKDKLMEKGKIYEAKNGYFRYIENKMYKAVVKIPIITQGEECEEQISETYLPKIPYVLFNKIYEFFKFVYDTHSSEVAVLLWYNFEEGVWDVEVPKQTIGAASVNYTRDEQFNTEKTTAGFICVGSIHSHCEMTAFHSGTDDKDEYNFDGVHITIGKVKTGPEFAQRFIVKHLSQKYEKIGDVVEMPFKSESFPETWIQQVSKHIYTPYTGVDKTLTAYGFSDFKSKYREDIIDWDIIEEEKRGKSKKNKRLVKECFTFFNTDLELFECPICGNRMASLPDDMKCEECEFPLYEDETKYSLYDEEKEDKHWMENPKWY